ncbi:glycoprotein UL22A [Saimiriine betaherpesvirus 4]|uniref:Glycoprotein UL22A n=1 Tax=Saimiriine betaherpesvirus 4 TaxID=1535247 RepID=G8XST5_9BETA|nr:glycoprotein UL22A [Saimiriine betaherpesvirus 4]AEV80882.1 glycoprotein UL22A [Saimiriine betaherpesvirus 4]
MYATRFACLLLVITRVLASEQSTTSLKEQTSTTQDPLMSGGIQSGNGPLTKEEHTSTTVSTQPVSTTLSPSKTPCAN